MIYNRSEHEWGLYLARILPDVDEASARALCLSLLTQSDDLWIRIETLPWCVLAALVKMVPDLAPAVLLVPRLGDSAELARLLHATAELAERVPRLPVALVINPRELRVWLEVVSGSRARTLIQEGLVELGAHAIDDGNETLMWLTRQGFQADTLTQYAEAASVIEKSREELTSEGAAQARSAAERFLHAVLEALPDTAGLFELNVKVAADFGASGRAEVDLVTQTLRVAIEIDGYFHFQDREHYRRDRRKDVALQKQGFLVLRFLTEDVVECLEEIVETIRASLAHQHKQRGKDSAANENISDSL
jgi:very-short-patch-repair endonuclease